ncbi:MAG: SAM-dependent methyltransferase [Bacteroidales bacterium]|nr:SAM-dependent methyltransferase [Bacteroidales bacterium]MDD3844141.1 SAM-dependent methyltransferase [Bacteroidales bacterium]
MKQEPKNSFDIFPKDLLDFIDQQRDGDTHRLLLSPPANVNIDIRLAVSTLEALKKLKGKADTWYNTKELVFPSAMSAEQCSSEIAAKYKALYFKGSVIVDLTGGLGVDSYFFSKHNPFVFYIEKDPFLCRAANHNFRVLSSNNISVLNKSISPHNITKILEDISKEHNGALLKIYLDPSRRKNGTRVKAMVQYEPSVAEIKREIFKYSDHIMVKISPMEDLKSTIEELGNVFLIDVVSIDNDCKEILIHMNPQQKIAQNNIPIHIAILKGMSKQIIEFTFEQEKNTICQYCTDSIEEYLYEPDVAILKAGAFKFVANKYQLTKLSRNTHLYTSDVLVQNFPGRAFKVKEVVDFDKTTIRNLSKKIPKATISTRNFPLPAETLRKRVKIADGGKVTLYGCTLESHVKKIIICERVN